MQDLSLANTSLTSLLGNLGAVLCAAMGLLGIFFPTVAARLVSIQPIGGIGMSEVRATYGGLFLAMGLTCLVLQTPHTFLVAGFSWLGAGVIRLLAIWRDRVAYSRGLQAVASELFIGSLLLCGSNQMASQSKLFDPYFYLIGFEDCYLAAIFGSRSILRYRQSFRFR